MNLASQPLTSIKRCQPRKQEVANALVNYHRANTSPPFLAPSNTSSVRIVCISDTHNKRPVVPLGDILIHAGDLTEHGSFDEMQSGLTWLSSQPHKHKIFVAGNHDVLIDERFLANYPERRYGEQKTKEDLNWRSVIYLQDAAVTLKISPARQRPEDGRATNTDSTTMRKLTIFGSPWSPKYGFSAFQYNPSDSQHWERTFASLDRKPDLVVTHGPPRLHLDRRDFHRAGCAYLAEEIRRVRPRFHLFGHIHASYGREDVILDTVQGAYEDVMTGWAGWGTVIWMAMLVAWAGLKRVFGWSGRDEVTTFVNAAVVGGPHNELRNVPVVVDL